MESKFAVLLLTIAAIGSSIRNVQAANVNLRETDPGATTFVVGGLIDLNCSVTGLTPGGATVQRIAWYHNGTEMENPPAYNEALMSSRLVVTTIAREDGGDYHCTAFLSDSSNTVSDTFTIVVHGIFTISVEGEFEVPLGSTATFRCTVDAVPAAVITWERLIDGELEEVVKQFSNNEDYGVLVRTVTLSDNGSWVCSASGSGGGRQEPFTVTVLVPPANTSITLPSANPQQTESSFELQCSAGGNRPPTFTWIYNGVNNLTELSMELDSRYEVDTVTGTLLVRDATYGDAGTYTCIATNKVGKDSANTTVTLEGRPEILVNQLTTLIKVRKSNDAYLSCPFISNPAPSSVEWRQGSTLLQSGGKYTIFENNGTLRISNSDATDAVSYTCTITNEHGADSRTFNLQVLDIPNAPTGFELVPLGGDGRMVRVMWNKSAEANSSTKQVEEYVIEQRINDGQFELSDQVFDANVTSGMLDNIQPGENYVFRVRARNIAGLSQPSNTQIYSPPAAAPSLLYFNVSALEDGRSVLLNWELEFTGGSTLTQFTVKIMLDNRVVRTIELDASLGSYIIRDLTHETGYGFSALLINSAGKSATFTSRANTTIAPPSKPTKPSIVSTTTSSIKISFSVYSGSRPISHLLLNITESKSSSESQKRFPMDEKRYIDSLIEKIDNESGAVVGYDVVMFITGLVEREKYEFEVAAESSIGVGEFSEPSERTKLEDDRIIYYIVGSVVCAVLVLVLAIVLVAVFACGKQRYNQRKKTIRINNNNKNAFPLDDTDNGLPFKSSSPSVNRHHSRDTLTSTTNGYYGNGHYTSSLPRSVGPHDRDGAMSPAYNRLGESPAPSGMTTPLPGMKNDSVIDMPENTTQIQTQFFAGKVAQNPQYNLHVPAGGQQSPRPQHMHLTLQTSLNDLQHMQTNSPTPDRYPESFSSERPFLSTSPFLNVHPSVLSRSNPTIGSRNMCDSMLLPGPTSQATDV